VKQRKSKSWLDNYDISDFPYELEEIIDSFLSKGLYFYNRVKFPRDTTNGCWLWTGTRNSGYGQLFYKGRRHMAHRFSWELHHQESIPDGLVIRHQCHNPLCVNPHHLTPGTQTENVADMIQAGREKLGRKLSEQDKLAIKISPLRTTELAKKYNVSKTTIHRIRNT
jgi:hypothetical protein